MRERDWEVVRARRAEVEAAERAERERIEAPIREATAKLEQTHRELTQVYTERLVSSVPDPDRFIDPTVGPDVRMSLKDAQSFTATQWNLFVGQHPEVFVSAALLDLLDSYFAKEQIRIVTADMFAKLIERFAACGLLPERPAPEPEPVNDTPEVIPEAPTGPTMHDGFDDDGRPKQFTTREVNLMSSTEFRRAFQVKTADLDLRGWGPGPKGRL